MQSPWLFDVQDNMQYQEIEISNTFSHVCLDKYQFNFYTSITFNKPECYCHLSNQLITLCTYICAEIITDLFSNFCPVGYFSNFFD